MARLLIPGPVNSPGGYVFIQVECPVESVPECEPEPQWNACAKYQSVRLHRLLGLESAQERHRNQHEGS